MNGPSGNMTPTPKLASNLADGRLWNRVLFGCVLAWAFLAMCFPLSDTDFWWHLKTGEWILAGNGIPSVDLYTFTDFDKPWIDLHWGFQVIIALVYRLGSVPLVTLFKAAVMTVCIAIAWLAGGCHLASWKKAAIWLLPLICITGRANERPEMLTMVFLATWLLIASRAEQEPKWIRWLPLVQLIWVNCHALFVLGLVVGLCYGIDATVRQVAKGRFGLPVPGDRLSLKNLWLFGLLSLVACFLNPYFEQGVLFPLVLYRKFSVEKAFYSQNIGEFQPPINFVLANGLTNLYVIAEFGAWLVAAFSFVWLLATQRRWSLFRLMLFAGFSHLAWQASRNTNIFALVSGFVACENFGNGLRSSAESSEANSVEFGFTRRAIAGYVILCLAVVTGVWNLIGEKNKPFALGEARNWFIHDAAKFAAQPGFPDRAFVANIGQADVYVYHNGPDRKVFMDARLEVCTQQTFELFNNTLIAMANRSDSWESLFSGGELPVVILDSRGARPSINGLATNPRWRMVFADPTAAVFLPTALADQLQLPLADPTPLFYPDGPPK